MEIHFILITLGILLLLGLFTDEIGRRTRLPRVTLLVLLGVAIGPSGFNLLPVDVEVWYPLFANLALAMVAFLLGGQLSRKTMRTHGREILIVSAAIAFVTASVVGVTLVAVGTPLVLALVLAGISTATAPAATTEVVNQLRAKGPLTTTILGVVALDDVWGLILFSLLLAAAKALAGDGMADVLVFGAWELFGAVALGVVIGLPAAYLTGRIGRGEPSQAEALGVVFLCAGLAIWLDVSFLLAGMVTGAIIVNFARHHNRPFHEIEHIEWPFIVLFFLLAGASLDVSALTEIGLVGAVYVVGRVLGRLLGGWIGVVWADAPVGHRRLLGPALLPQAGVALGMALVAANALPGIRDTVLAITIGATVIFELVGPLMTQRSLEAAGEVRLNREKHGTGKR